MRRQAMAWSIQLALMGVAASAAAQAPASSSVQQLDAVQVTGSRIPRAQVEGPAPITVINAEQIRSSGFTSVPDVLRAMTQNGGETQSPQSSSGADFSPGAQQVDLRGLGPNHTLVLVNGRRIADFPMPFKGRSNFTDVSNIPLGMIERIEVLTGSASAIYGSDAIAGVVNFILKKKADGTTVDMRLGTTTEGGGESFDMSLASGFSRGNFHAVYSVELQSQTPLWAYERDIQDSTQDGPTEGSRIARRAYLRTDYNDDYLDPGAATCEALSGQNQGSTYRAYRPKYGYYCGSDSSIGYGTILSKRRGANGYASLSYDFDNGQQWFADVQLGYHTLSLMRDVTKWGRMDANGDESGYFNNEATGEIEFWQRQFSPEEMGGLRNAMVRSTQKTFSVTTGFKGNLAGNWDYEAALSHSQYQSRISWAQIIAAKANDLFLGPQLGVDDDGFPIYNADPSRLYRPLTRAEYDAIAARTTYTPKSRTETAAFTLTNSALFALPGGDAGFAATVEVGQQAYSLNPDPLATQYYYYSWKDSDGNGSRNRWATAAELRMPLRETVNLSVAGRYDQYRYSGHTIGKATWSGGLEWRPIDTLLVRGSYGTAFRAPDLHYVFAGPGNDETSAEDLYSCRADGASDCADYERNLIRSRTGNRQLDPETSTSWSAGVVWSPAIGLDLSVDWFDIDMRNQVQDMDVRTILANEANCRLGSADVTSPTCVDALARITRSNDGRLYGVRVEPINVARESTSGIDVGLRYRLQTGIGDFIFNGTHTWVKKHDFQRYPGDRSEDQFAVNSGFDIPRTKTGLSVTWEKEAWSATVYGSRLGKLPTSDSYDQVFDWDSGDSPYVKATYRYNASLQYRVDDHSRLSLSVVNVFNKMPPKDRTYTAYPYYDVSWFDSVGRTINLQYTHKFGGSAL
ncbi:MULTISPECIES: TonB-dependent receptor plug domain-containing protein [Stenotrophomonas]|uniref:TonB-dependent receptor n=1 Tax=Stenotrophomonas pavanii TaxID=487698 RepID=A0A246L276_9GAMM|nr:MULTISPECIES: TonB-dependent receptor [Stenotrophomonas]MBC9080662.1 TonB-dependent receptor [Stenotrophomonas maltophilia]MBC9092288.1 TonB-dependent receptor [Stenotrophomonas maltophilia]MBH1390594.1 TonB-dependent receptor [Stenotrophomonas maltophilia]MBH1520361.1 TonB-dependent receptor [Stenotrophomonas maltophilia]MBN4942789.1 TonB-dependent receptor [Stenotrophomonas maltophilia]